MSTTYATKPVYPMQDFVGEVISPGMTLREHYAGRFGAAIIGNLSTIGLTQAGVADTAVDLADTLIARLERDEAPESPRVLQLLGMVNELGETLQHVQKLLNQGRWDDVKMIVESAVKDLADLELA